MLLVLFAFGISPKITLHNLVANHKDGRTKSVLSDPYSTQLSKASFNCQCDNLVSESPFVEETSAPAALPLLVFDVYKDGFIEEVYSSNCFSFSLRGPPAC
jgi:hypothetical protein